MDGSTAFQKTNDASPFTAFRKINAIYPSATLPFYPRYLRGNRESFGFSCAGSV